MTKTPWREFQKMYRFAWLYMICVTRLLHLHPAELLAVKWMHTRKDDHLFIYYRETYTIWVHKLTWTAWQYILAKNKCIAECSCNYLKNHSVSMQFALWKSLTFQHKYSQNLLKTSPTQLKYWRGTYAVILSKDHFF